MNPSSNDTNGRASNRAAINGANAKHSTGPRTAAGKQRSSLNAWRHGLTGQVIVLPAEDQAAYQRHLKRFVDLFQPKTVLEEELVQTLGDCRWRLNRIAAMENNFVTLAAEEQLDSIHTNEPLAASALAQAKAMYRDQRSLANITIYEQRIARLFDRTLKQLQEIQAERREREQRDMMHAARILEMHESQDIPYDPAQDGFVFSIAEIQTFLRRRNRLDEAYCDPEDRLAAAS
jgi:hypothetical protein